MTKIYRITETKKTLLSSLLEAGYEGSGYSGAGYEGGGYDEEEAKQAGFHANIDKDTLANDNFRKVIFTTPKTQLVLMTLQPGVEIGTETHNGDQFFRFEAGNGTFVLDGNEWPVSDGDAVVVPEGKEHNVINTGEEPLRLYALYAPPQNEDGTVDETKPEDD